MTVTHASSASRINMPSVMMIMIGEMTTETLHVKGRG